MQMWTDLLDAGVDQDKIDHQPKVLLKVWHQLKPKQQFRHGHKPPTERDRPVNLKNFLKLQYCLLILYDYREGQGANLEGISRDQRSHVESTIHWFPNNVQRVLVRVHTRTDSSLNYGNPGKFPGPATY